MDLADISLAQPLVGTSWLNNLKSATTQVDMSDEVVRVALEIAQRIRPSDLHERGIEAESHITVRYGLQDDPLDGVKQIVADFVPFTVEILGLSLFENADFDVLKFDAESAPLRQLHKQLSQFRGEVVWPDYNPHMTVAYLRPSTGRDYLRSTSLDGALMIVNQLTFVSTDRVKTSIRLGATGLTQPAKGVFADRRY